MHVRSHLLAKLSPLLGAAVGLEAGDSFSATLTPLQMHLPAECYSLRLEPLKLVLATRGLLSGVITLLKWVTDSLQKGVTELLIQSFHAKSGAAQAGHTRASCMWICARRL